MDGKVPWSGIVIGVQPRIRLTRSFDQRQHSYLGYVLLIEGTIGGVERAFSIGIGKGAHEKHAFRAGDCVHGLGVPPRKPRVEIVDLYKVSRLKLEERGPEPAGSGPPWTHSAPALPVYRRRGHRRLSARTYATSCRECIWGCEMPVEMIIDQWNPQNRRYRRETFCYGPKSCTRYKPGPKRKVPGRKGMTWEEEDCVDEDATAHRGPDE